MSERSPDLRPSLAQLADRETPSLARAQEIRKTPLAWRLFGTTPPGWPRVQAICDFVHNHIRFDCPGVDGEPGDLQIGPVCMRPGPPEQAAERRPRDLALRTPVDDEMIDEPAA